MATIEKYDPSHHAPGSSKDGNCAQGGGKVRCGRPPEFSVIGATFRVATCAEHLAGAVRDVLGMPAVKARKTMRPQGV